MADLGKIDKDATNRNMSRGLKRKTIRRSKLPPAYYADIPCWDEKEKCVKHSAPSFLIYELIYHFIATSALSLSEWCSVQLGSVLSKSKMMPAGNYK